VRLRAATEKAKFGEFGAFSFSFRHKNVFVVTP